MTKRFAHQVVLVVSDSLGATGYEVARAACGQFDGVEIAVERLTKVNDADVVEGAVRQLLGEGGRSAFCTPSPTVPCAPRSVSGFGQWASTVSTCSVQPSRH